MLGAVDPNVEFNLNILCKKQPKNLLKVYEIILKIRKNELKFQKITLNPLKLYSYI
jgi:hypothetical protein